MCDFDVCLEKVIFDETLSENVYIELYEELKKKVTNFQLQRHISLQFEAYFLNKMITKFNKDIEKIL